MEKDGEVREDDSIRAQDEVQKAIDKAVADIDKLVEDKTQEIMADSAVVVLQRDLDCYVPLPEWLRGVR